MLNSEVTRSPAKVYQSKPSAFKFDVLRPARRLGELVIDPASRVRLLQPNPKLDIAMEDCHLLLSAVATRLKACVAPRSSTNSVPQLQVQILANEVQTSVLECAAALDQLQKTLQHEFESGRRLKLQALDNRVASPSARRYFVRRLDCVLEMVGPNRQALALLCLDLDRFRLVTAVHGREVGEELVRIMDARVARKAGPTGLA
jgi:predicted signal transduction protein with EAL and GGDEF domain